MSQLFFAKQNGAAKIKFADGSKLESSELRTPTYPLPLQSEVCACSATCKFVFDSVFVFVLFFLKFFAEPFSFHARFFNVARQKYTYFDGKIMGLADNESYLIFFDETGESEVVHKSNVTVAMDLLPHIDEPVKQVVATTNSARKRSGSTFLDDSDDVKKARRDSKLASSPPPFCTVCNASVFFFFFFCVSI